MILLLTNKGSCEAESETVTGKASFWKSLLYFPPFFVNILFEAKFLKFKERHGKQTMKNIKKIFLRDVASLIRHPFALIIALGLCLIPALYAWFNIYSNWDPYGNTGNMQIAVASEDAGYTDENGSKVNVAQTVMDTLKENKSIDWVRVKTEKEALNGVSAGKYYAAVVFSKDFTECMYHGFLEGLKRPSVTYYVNEKKNAVATKITDTAVTTLETNINEQYIALIVSRLFEKQKTAVEGLKQKEIADAIVSKLAQAKERTEHFSVVVKSLVQANDKLTASIDGAQSDFQTIQTQLSQAQENVDSMQDTQPLSQRLSFSGGQALQSVNQAAAQLAQAQRTKVEERKKAYVSQVTGHLSQAKSMIDKVISAVEALNAATSLDLPQGIVLSQLTAHSGRLEGMIAQLESGSQAQDIKILEDMEAQLSQQIESLRQELQQTVSQSLTKLEDACKQKEADISQAVSHAREDIDLLSMALDQGKQAAGSMNEGFRGIAKELGRMETKLELLTETVNRMDGAQIVENFVSFLKGNSKEYGAFFASPVEVETHTVYPVDNYGSGVAPFYTTLALWVGGVVLVSLIKVKVKANARGLIDPKPHELFFGRYLLFFALALVQAAVTVWGDLYLLHIQCLYPRRLLLAAFVTSFTFSLLIYALTISFGDIGKAVIVVLMVIQIAGSSGTYPIEILPEFYQKMYIFFPFPYAINAMREAIAGMYGKEYVLDLMQLMLFAAGALMLGLVIRLPFRKFYGFVEKRMEDTGMM